MGDPLWMNAGLVPGDMQNAMQSALHTRGQSIDLRPGAVNRFELGDKVGTRGRAVLAMVPRQEPSFGEPIEWKPGEGC